MRPQKDPCLLRDRSCRAGAEMFSPSPQWCRLHLRNTILESTGLKPLNKQNKQTYKQTHNKTKTLEAVSKNVLL